MNEKHGKSEKELFAEALDLEPGERAAYLDEACGNDQELLARIQRLLDAHDAASGFLEEPLGGTASVDLNRIGRFRILRELGRGGQGTVYEAEQISLKRKVALKVLPSHLSFSSDAVKKFQREAEAGGRQSHFGIVAIHAVGEDKGIHYIAQELVGNGQTLTDEINEIRERGEQPPGYFRKIAHMIVDVASALQHAHDSGVIHRDIKPSNILLTEDGRPKVTDFGLAKVEDALALSRTGDFAGTPYYMSPEQAMSRRMGIDKRTDIYSLGVTLYELLTMRRPFEGKTSQEVLKKIILNDPENPQNANPKVPNDLSVICLKAMEKDPNRRYQAMTELAEDLNRFLDGDVILAKPAGLIVRILTRVKRYPILSGAIGIALIAILGLIVSIPWYIIKITHEKNKVLRLSDTKVLADLLNEQKMLWPAYPEMIPAMKAWLAKAEELKDRYEIHFQTLNDFRSSAWSEKDSFGSEQTYLFKNMEDQWQHDTLCDLVSGLEDLFDNKTGLYKSVQDRLGFAVTIEKRSIEGCQKLWDEAIDSIADEEKCPQYGGRVIEEMIGFVPISRDPESGLWEFVHLQTGEVPERGETGKLILTEEMGLVFVLIPGGTFNMGAVRPSEDVVVGSPNVDPNPASDEAPVHTVNVPPFLISKYEMTQNQWLRAFEENPSNYGPDCKIDILGYNLLHPVEQISWEDCEKLLWRLDLRLPTEAEWEYAARAGTSSTWYTGNDNRTLDGHANICDLSYDRIGAPGWIVDEWLDDGYVRHAPVGRYLSNAFGLHDVHGNLWEWCQDNYHENYIDAPFDGSAWLSGDVMFKVCRGGSYISYSNVCRSSIRSGASKNRRASDIGLRPAASVK